MHVAGYDPERAARIYQRWTLEDFLAKVKHEYRQEAIEQYRFEVIQWALLAPHTKKRTDAPEVPAILRER